LEDDFALGALHEQDAFVAQHAWAVDVDDGAQKVLQLGRVEGAVGLEDKAFHIVIVVVVMPAFLVMAVLVRRVVAVLAMGMVVVGVAVVLQKIGVNAGYTLYTKNKEFKEDSFTIK
jgi:hypothetical protein